MQPNNLYELWVQFVSSIVGLNAPTIVYAFSFILFWILFFDSFLGIIKFIFNIFKGK